MDNLDVILEEIMVGIYSKVISSEEKILKKLSELGLKEFNTLDAIAQCTKSKTNTANNIAKVLSITPGTLTTNLDRLQEKGYIAKEKSQEDKRIVIISLTPAGASLRKKREAIHKKLIANAIARLTPTEKVTLVSALNKIEF